ncbi:MAG: hypothetical protein U0S76_01995 [Pseudoxanthomonas sp.]|nr:hypothetical protein [Pseudoxanthomonas sp.]
MRLPALVLLLAFVAPALACPEPPFNETVELGGTATWLEGDDGCALDVRIDANVRGSAAMAHVRRRDQAPLLELAFRVDLSTLTGLNAVQAFDLVHAVSAQSAGSGDQRTATVFALSVFGNIAGTSRNLGVSAPCPGQPGGQCTLSVPLPVRPEITLRLEEGAGTGSLRLWVDTPTSDAPTAVLNGLDTVALGGIERLALGVGNPSTGFLAGHATRIVRFDRIALADDQLAWISHEAGEDANCPVGVPFPLGSVSGSTCTGSHDLPALASGSTRNRSPAVLYRFTLPEPRHGSFAISEPMPFGVALFLCEVPCGPATRCIATGDATNPLTFSQLQGTWYLVVKPAGGPAACGNYILTYNGPLG